MRSVKFIAKSFFLGFILLVTDSVYSEDCRQVWGLTDAEVAAKSTGKGIKNFFTFKWRDLDYDPKLLKYIQVYAVKNQGVNGYFNSQIEVCSYEGKDCRKLHSQDKCQWIQGDLNWGGIAAAAFIDWDGDKTTSNAEVAQGLGWEWADGVTDEEKKEFAHSPKICACSQKAACLSGFGEWITQVSRGKNIFHPGNMENVCDTCYQKKVKCAPIPLAPGPPPLCDQLECSPPQVRIVPVGNKDNDYFDPKVKVMIGALEEGKYLGFSGESSIDYKDGSRHYFKTYREEGKLCAQYYGTKGIEDKNLQFTHCFPAPSAPQPEIEKVVNNGRALRIKVKMSNEICNSGRLDNAHYSSDDGFCTFDIYDWKKTYSFKVVKPAMVEKDRNKQTYEVLERILENNSTFNTLREYGCVPGINAQCAKFGANKKCEAGNFGEPKIEIEYQKKDQRNNKMLCISGYQPEPEEFVIERNEKIIPLKLMKANYAKYVSIYLQESKHVYYLPLNDTDDLLDRKQEELDDIVFDKQGYISIPNDKNNEGRKVCIAKKDTEINEKRETYIGECEIVYKLVDSRYTEKCKKEDDGCICVGDNNCNRSTRFVNKNNGKLFYFKYEEVDCKDKNGKTQKCYEPQEVPVKVDRAEVFYADKLCTFDLDGLRNGIRDTIKKWLREKKRKVEDRNSKSYDLGGSNDYTDNLSQYEYVEIEAWGGGEAGHINGKAKSTEDRIGMPGDYIKAKLKVDPNYPYIKVEVTEGGGNQEDAESNKDGGPTMIKICSSNSESENGCKELITVRGGGQFHEYGGKKYTKTKIHRDLTQEETQIIKAADVESIRGKDRRVAYIENGKIKYEAVSKCNIGGKSNRRGAGGCIDKSARNYGKGAAGHAIITPIMKEIDMGKVENAIDKLLEDKGSKIDIEDNDMIKTIDPDIDETIRQAIEKELSCKAQ
ncbi:MAG: hypothetical protein QWI36_04305 [Wolbachia endosymbiont of Tyrophagus putrescentiae]|nr:hypothetical protein [Wolbachia endosymbiont of Tyrophagus putrescentiae]